MSKFPSILAPGRGLQSIFARALAASILFSSLPLTVPADASEALFKPLFEEGKKNVNKTHNYVEGQRLLEMALQNSEHLQPDSPEMLSLYNELGQAYTCRGNLSKAEEMLKKCLDLREKSKKKEDFLIFQTVMQLGTVYRRQDKFAESEALYKRGLSMFEGKGPIKSLCQALVMYALGTLYLDEDKNSEAETLLNQALVVRKQSFLKGAFPESSLYESLGRALFQQGKLDEAEADYKLAMEIYKKKDKDSRDLAFLEGNLAAVYSAQNKNQEAKDLLQDSIKIIEKTDGTESSNAATIYSRLSEIAITQDRYEEGESLIKKAIAIHEKLAGADNTSVGYDLTKLMDVLKNQGKYGDAEALGKRCVQIFTTKLGPNNTNTGHAMERLAWVYYDQGKYNDAEPLCNEAIRIYTQKDGPSSHDLPSVLRELAMVEKGLKNTSKAQSLLLQAADLLEKDKNADSLLLGHTYWELALLYRQDNVLDKAEESSKKALALYEKVFGTEHARLLADLNFLSKLYKEQNKASEASNIDARISAIYAKHPELKAADSTVKSTPIVAASASVAVRSIKNKWALVVGISNFEDPDINLRYAAKDAIDFSNYLVNDAHFSSDHVKLLTDKEATRDNIIKQLGADWLGRRAGPEDLVVIYVSSHGSTAKSEAGGVNFLVAHDTKPDALLSTGIPMQWLSQIIKEQVHSNRVVLVLDVCHSGSTSAGEKGLTRETSFDVGQVKVGEGQAIICSSAPEQVSWESKNYPNSVFTRRLIEGLRQDNSGADLNRAYAYLRDQVESEVLRDRGRLQTPLLFSKSWQGAPPVLSVSTGS